MKRTLLLLVAMGFTAGASAQQFKWVDKDGRTQYGDTPPPGVKATRIKPPPAGTATAPAAPAASKDGKKPLSPEAGFQKRQQEREAEEKKANETAEADAARRQNCESAQAQVRTIQSGQRMSTTNAQGERVFLDDSQIAAELARAQKAVAESCK